MTNSLNNIDVLRANQVKMLRMLEKLRATTPSERTDGDLQRDQCAMRSDHEQQMAITSSCARCVSSSNALRCAVSIATRSSVICSVTITRRSLR